MFAGAAGSPTSEGAAFVSPELVMLASLVQRGPVRNLCAPVPAEVTGQPTALRFLLQLPFPELQSFSTQW